MSEAKQKTEPQRWAKVESLFLAASELAVPERAAFLSDACGNDEELQCEVEALLLSDDQAEKFIEAPALALAGDLLGAQTKRDVGRNIGPYEIMREIDRGGMGTVYLARRADQQYEKEVAIKIVKRGLDTEDIRRHFRHERQILASLDHPNIAHLIDGGTTEEGLPYLVMDYVKGLSINYYCDNHKLSTPERLGLFLTICSAVQYAHQHLVVHRDIKPGNVLVTEDGTPKLLDFGIAKLLDPTQPDSSSHTVTRLGVMTPEYASPEQVKGESVTTASDVYSLGVLLYELLTGHRPYRIKSRRPDEIARVICEQEPAKPSAAVTRVEEQPGSGGQPARIITPQSISELHGSEPRKLRRLLDGDLDNIVLMSMRKEPARRYASVEQFSEDIRRHLEGLPVVAHKDTFSYRSAKFVRRHRTGVTAAALLLLTLMGGIIITLREARIARMQQARAERRFQDVRQLASSFIFEFHDSIENLPGSTPARELLVKRALEYLDSLAQEAGDDPSLQRELVAAYVRVGNVQGNPTNANLGDSPGALQSYRKALAIAERLVAANPSDSPARRSLAVVHEKMSDLQDGTGDISHAAESEQKSLAIFKALAQAAPTDVEAQQSLAISYIKLGDVLGNSNFANLGDQSGAMQNYQFSLAILQSLYASDPTALRTRRRLGLIYERIGSILEAEGNTSGALDAYRKSLTLRQALVADYPTNTDAIRDVAIAHEKIGNAMTAMGNLTAAFESRAKSLEIFKGLVKADPQNVQAQRSLAISYVHMGDLFGNPDSMNLRRPDEALKNYELALAILKNVSPPGDVQISITEGALGECLTAQKHYPEAEPLLVKGYNGVKGSLGEKDPRTIEALKRLVTLYRDWKKPDMAAQFNAMLSR